MRPLFCGSILYNLQEALIIEKMTLEDENKVEGEINRGLKMVHKTIIEKMNKQLELLQQELTSTKVKVYKVVLHIDCGIYRMLQHAYS